jgi:hypothetical protein
MKVIQSWMVRHVISWYMYVWNAETIGTLYYHHVGGIEAACGLNVINPYLG